MIVSPGRREVARALAATLLTLGLLVSAAHAQPDPGPARLDSDALRTLLATLGYQPREARNESGLEFEITLRPPGGLAISTRVTLSKDATLVWLVAWLKKVPPGRTISGDAILDMLVQNDAIGPTHFSYNERGRWFFLNRPVPSQGLTAERLRAELQQLGATVARTEPLWDVDRWK